MWRRVAKVLSLLGMLSCMFCSWLEGSKGPETETSILDLSRKDQLSPMHFRQKFFLLDSVPLRKGLFLYD